MWCVRGSGKLQYATTRTKACGVQCFYVRRLKEQGRHMALSVCLAMWASCCRARRRRLQDDGGFPVNCGPVHMHMHMKLLMLCTERVRELLILFPSSWTVSLIFMRAFVRLLVSLHVTVVTACRSQDFQGWRKRIWDHECRGRGLSGAGKWEFMRPFHLLNKLAAAVALGKKCSVGKKRKPNENHGSSSPRPLHYICQVNKSAN